MKTHINIGTGIDLTIKELAEQVKSIVGYKGSINWDVTKPDGTKKKQQDVGLLNKLNWTSSIDLQKGVKLLYENYVK